ncbi:class I tRNA ligase family protein, partial [Candidatus Pacearchaeota archaeon]|nr:class I tRNA ligase family protein [Candidatus Pacearchaeota archaeon]
MAKNKFNFKESEQKWMTFWEKEDIYKADLTNKKIFSVDTPPPTVSGEMHIGHAFSYSQQDFIVRFNRMLKGSAFYPFGTDDNGLPTERLVEKLNKVKSKNMTR